LNVDVAQLQLVLSAASYSKEKKNALIPAALAWEGLEERNSRYLEFK
jgi:hypothetical protein